MALFFNVNRGFWQFINQFFFCFCFFCGTWHLCAVSIYLSGVDSIAEACFPVIHKSLIRLQFQIRCVRMSSSVMFLKAGACG